MTLVEVCVTTLEESKDAETDVREVHVRSSADRSILETQLEAEL